MLTGWRLFLFSYWSTEIPPNHLHRYLKSVYGCFHYFSDKHLSRHFNEISICREYLVPVEKSTNNDLAMGKLLGIDDAIFNNYGSSLIFGHPQGPTTMRLLIELIEELVLKGGGYGLLAGCAAGDTGAALVVKVNG